MYEQSFVPGWPSSVSLESRNAMVSLASAISKLFWMYRYKYKCNKPSKNTVKDQLYVFIISLQKHLGITLTTFLGCLSCINVTKECYQIGKASLVTLVSEDLFGYIPAISTTNHATKELRASRCV